MTRSLPRALLRAALLLALTAPATPAAEPEPQTGLLRRELATEPPGSYWLYVPRDYRPTAQYGLVVALHAAGLRGDHPARQWGALVERAGGLIVLAPDCRDAKRRLWSFADEALVLAAVRRVRLEYPIAPDRVLLTGFSWGANYAYKFGLRHPDVFRAIAPFSGVLLARPSPAADAILRRARDVAVTIVHGAEDRRVPVARARASRDRLEAMDYRVVYRELPHVGHQVPPEEALRVLAWFKALAPRTPERAPPAPKGKE